MPDLENIFRIMTDPTYKNVQSKLKEIKDKNNTYIHDIFNIIVREPGVLNKNNNQLYAKFYHDIVQELNKLNSLENSTPNQINGIKKSIQKSIKNSNNKQLPRPIAEALEPITGTVGGGFFQSLYNPYTIKEILLIEKFYKYIIDILNELKVIIDNINQFIKISSVDSNNYLELGILIKNSESIMNRRFQNDLNNLNSKNSLLKFNGGDNSPGSLLNINELFYDFPKSSIDVNSVDKNDKVTLKKMETV